MTPEQEGGYIRLLALMWTTEDCELWNNEEYLCKLSRIDRLAIALPLRCFKVSSKNKENITHKRLLEERAKQDEHREKMSKAGKLGNKIKYGNKAKISLSDSKAIAPDRSPSSSPSPSSNKEPPTPLERGIYSKLNKNQQEQYMWRVQNYRGACGGKDPDVVTKQKWIDKLLAGEKLIS